VADFPGFGISGYRTLAGEVQWIPLNPAITVFLGGNNSGKSNILRLVHEHMGGIFHSLKEGQALNTFNPRVDAPRDRGHVGLRVVWALDVHTASAEKVGKSGRGKLRPGPRMAPSRTRTATPSSNVTSLTSRQ
jgi:hypothetical protein